MRRPFRPARFAGETPIVSRLEAGPVEVINLMGERRRVRLDLAYSKPAWRNAWPGHAHCLLSRRAGGAAPGRRNYDLQADGGLKIEDIDGVATCNAGLIVLGSVTMRIAVVGAGGVGGGFGAALAKAGADVTFIARGAHLAAMKSKGLKLESPRGDIHLVPTQATDDPRPSVRSMSCCSA